jgi:tripartite-type tricarboxylate transporter receptor subunit TctC
LIRATERALEVSLNRARPDGYTLFAGNLTTGIITQEFHETDYRLQDFSYVYRWFKGPLDIIVNYDSPFKSFSDLVAKGRRRTFKVAAVGLGDMGHLMILQLEKRTGIKTTSIPYGGGGPATAAVINLHTFRPECACNPQDSPG